MRQWQRAATLLGVLAVAGSSAVLAQIPGMPLFTNPRYGTGVRVHADIGQPTDSGTNMGEVTVVQGGVTLAIGPIGLGANLGMRRNDLEAVAANCANCKPETAWTGSALAQLRIAGGGSSNLSLSLFGGASMDVQAYDFADLTSQQRAALAALGVIGDGSRQLTIPLGAAIGLRIPLGLASLNLWGAPRYNMFKYINCPTGSTLCDDTNGDFRWAVGADFPIFRVLSVRAAYDAGKIGGETVSVWGVGASIGIGGMR